MHCVGYSVKDTDDSSVKVISIICVSVMFSKTGFESAELIHKSV